MISIRSNQSHKKVNDLIWKVVCRKQIRITKEMNLNLIYQITHKSEIENDENFLVNALA